MPRQPDRHRGRSSPNRASPQDEVERARTRLLKDSELDAADSRRSRVALSETGPPRATGARSSCIAIASKKVTAADVKRAAAAVPQSNRTVG